MSTPPTTPPATLSDLLRDAAPHTEGRLREASTRTGCRWRYSTSGGKSWFICPAEYPEFTELQVPFIVQAECRRRRWSWEASTPPCGDVWAFRIWGAVPDVGECAPELACGVSGESLAHAALSALLMALHAQCTY